MYMYVCLYIHICIYICTISIHGFFRSIPCYTAGALGRVIAALARRDKFVSFRDSALTQMLKETLTGPLGPGEGGTHCE